MPGTNLDDGTGIWLASSVGNARLAGGTTVPTDATTGYSTGCLFQKTDGGVNTALYVNQGTNSSCAFVPITGASEVQAGTSLPADAATGYNTGALYQLTNGTAPAVVYENLGTTSSATFRPVGVGASTNDGFNKVETVRATFDTSANTAYKAVGTYSLAATVPNGALVVNGFCKVNTAFSSAASTATVAVFVQGANDFIAAAAVSGAPWSTAGVKATLPNASTAGGGISTTAAQAVKVIVGAEALTGGKLTAWVNYIL